MDPDDHHLYASLGCAAENLLVAAEAAGLKGHLAFDPSVSGVRVALESAPPVRSDLFDAIPRRQCSRSDYDAAALAAAHLRALEVSTNGDGVSVVMLTDQRKMDEVAECVAAGNTAQFDDPAWAAELKSWIRFNAREATRAGDGLYGPVMGNPNVPRWLGSLFMRLTFSARAQNRKDIGQIRSSSAVAVIFSDADDKRHWIAAGRAFERLALRATTLELRTAFINQPVEVPVLRSQFAAYLGIGDRRPDMIVRIGHGSTMPRSLRRPVEQVLV